MRSGGGSRTAIWPLDPAVDAAVIGMQKIAEVLDQVRRDCSDRSESL